MDTAVQEWVQIALEDFEVASILFSEKRFLHSVFMCQQATEKMIKSLYQQRFKALPPGKHDLFRLADDSGILGECSDSQKMFLSTLTEFYIESRYPGDRASLSSLCDEGFAGEIMRSTGEMIAWLRNQLTE